MENLELIITGLLPMILKPLLLFAIPLGFMVRFFKTL